MKILRVIPSMNPKAGGPCQGIRNSIPEFKKLGIENEVLCFDKPDADYLGNDDFIIHTIGEAEGIYAYLAKLHPWIEKDIIRFCADLHSWLEKYISNFDIIIIHGIWLYHSYGVYSFWAKYKKSNKNAPRLYIMPHGMLDPYFQKAKDRKLKAIRNWFLWKLIEGKVVNGVDGILFTCQQELLLARTTFGSYLPKQELNVGYGIPQPPIYTDYMKQAFSEKCEGWNGKPFLLFLSRIDRKKGVDLLISAYLKFKNRDKDKGLPQLVIAGPGLDTSYGLYIRKMTNNDPDILFTGMLLDEAKWGAFYNCEAFILPSHQENFGIAIVEALACGKPVLISNKVNIWMEIEANKAGIIDIDTEEGISDLLDKWFSLSYHEQVKIGNRARRAYQEYFSIEENVKKMLKVF